MMGAATGLGLLAGIRLYATVFLLGVAVRWGWFDLPADMQPLAVLGDLRVLTVSGALCGIEFLADKIMWIDSAWDSIHTLIRPVGAALLGATAFASFDPATQVGIALLCGGLAFTGHSSKAATRLAVNHSPEPFSNIALSLVEDLIVPVGLWLVLAFPLVALSLVILFLVLFIWLSRKILRFWSARFRRARAS